MELLMTKDAPAILLRASSISYDCHRPSFSVSKNLPLSCLLKLILMTKIIIQFRWFWLILLQILAPALLLHAREMPMKGLKY